MGATDHSRRTPAPGCVVLMWEQFGAYHLDRLAAMACAFEGQLDVVGVEVASRSSTYAWDPIEDPQPFIRQTLFPDTVAETLPWWRKFTAAFRAIRAAKPRAVFLCNQEQPEILLLLPLLRLLGIPAFAMLDAKFDDTPRRVMKEVWKQVVFRLYRGGLVAGSRTVDYYRFLGMPKNWSRPGYDTVSVARIRAAAGLAPAPRGVPHGERDFVVVARFVPKKNIFLAVRAFAHFRKMPSAHDRRLVLCGSGALEPQLRALVAELGVVSHVDFVGFLMPDGICQQLARSLALILPSVEEQWGLVVNEAVALGVPVLCSDNVGARDTLVRVGVNGFVFEPDNDVGLAKLMHLLSEDRALWRDFAEGSLRLAPAGDVAEFVRGVGDLIHLPAMYRSREVVRSPQFA